MQKTMQRARPYLQKQGLYGQGMSGKVRETCNDQGEIALLQAGQGKMLFFIRTEVFDLFCLHFKFILL